jgi:hypothetical protein
MSQKLTNNRIFEEIVELTVRENDGVAKDLIYINVLRTLADVVARGWGQVKWIDKTPALVNFYGFCFADSGSGKDKIPNFLKNEVFNHAYDVYDNWLMARRESVAEKAKRLAMKEFPSKDDGKRDSQQTLLNRKNMIKELTPRKPEIYCSAGTREGFVANRLAIKTLGGGCTSIIIPELAKELRGVRANDTSFIDFAMQLYDTGSNEGKLTKGDATIQAVDRVPNNMLAYTTLEIVNTDEKKKEIFKEIFAEGFARRALVYVGKPTVYKPKAGSYEEFVAKHYGNESKTSTAQWQIYFSELQKQLLEKVGSVIEVEKDASYHLLSYQDSCNLKVEEGLYCKAGKSEASNRFWKALKIAGILAYTERKNTVDLQCIKDAINLVEHFGEYSQAFLKELSTKVSKLEKETDYLSDIFEYALKNGSWFSKSEVRRMFRTASSSRADEIIEELLDYAFEQGYKCIFQKPLRGGNGGKYIMEKIAKSEDIKVGLSVCSALKHDYEPVLDENGNELNLHEKYNMVEPFEWTGEGEETLESALTVATCCNYSAGRFKDNYRNAKNWLGGNTMLIYDIDDGMSIDEAQSMFLDTACAIMPTKSHRKEKNGIICDRFRIFIPLEKPIDFTDEKRFKRIMNNVGEAFKLTFDKATVDPSRMFYPSTTEALEQAWFNPFPLHFVDWKMFDYDVMGNSELNQVARFHNATYSFAGSSKETVERGIRKFFKNNYADGNRNHTIFRAFRWLKDKGFNESEAVGFVQELSASNPLPRAEFETTLRSAWK